MDQEKFDNLARSVASLASRRRLIAGAGTSLAALIGARFSQLFDPESAEAKGRAKRQHASNHKRNDINEQKKKKKKKKNKTTTTTAAPTTTTAAATTTTTAAATTTTTRAPNASERCLQAGAQCGTNANQQGTCRSRAPQDGSTLPGIFACTNNTAVNACTTTLGNCGSGNNCVVNVAADGAAGTTNCRVVIP